MEVAIYSLTQDLALLRKEIDSEGLPPKKESVLSDAQIKKIVATRRKNRGKRKPPEKGTS